MGLQVPERGTVIFRGTLHEGHERCAGSREQAEAMHEVMVAQVRAECRSAKEPSD